MWCFKLLTFAAVFLSFGAYAVGFRNCGATLTYLNHTREEDRIVVVGLGAVTPLGRGVSLTWNGAAGGRSGIGPIQLFAGVESLPVRIAGQVPDFQFGSPSQYGFLNRGGAMSRTHQFAVVAAVEAALDSGILKHDGAAKWFLNHESSQTGVFIGSTQGDIAGVEEAMEALVANGGLENVSLDGQLALKGIPGLAPGHVSIALRAQGPLLCPSSACASGSQSIALGARMLPDLAQVMVVGGADAQISRLGIIARERLSVLSRRNDNPAAASRPFDRDRDGFVMGEGAGVLVLTTERHAKAMGYPIKAYLAGYGMTGDAAKVTDPSSDGQARAMRLALARAGLEPGHIGYIHAHGTSTKKGDPTELEGIAKVFGSHARTVRISSTKSHMGHLLGASGSVGAVIAIQAMLRGFVPPTLNLLNSIAPDFQLVPLVGEEVDIEAVAVNSFGLGGHNVVLVFVRPPR